MDISSFLSQGKRCHYQSPELKVRIIMETKYLKGEEQSNLFVRNVLTIWSKALNGLLSRASTPSAGRACANILSSSLGTS